MVIEAIPTLPNNYIRPVHHGRAAILADPSKAGPILSWLKDRNMTAEAILVAARHNHAGSIAEWLGHASIPLYRRRARRL
ncbi:MAG: hypothetical protein Q8O79_09415 [Pseudomonadota bacterium]|nr:hypothetical protein [Pseudomonadota bacterium]